MDISTELYRKLQPHGTQTEYGLQIQIAARTITIQDSLFHPGTSKRVYGAEGNSTEILRQLQELAEQPAEEDFLADKTACQLSDEGCEVCQ